MSAALELVPNTEEWYEERRKYLGASDAAAAVGLSKWATPADVVADKLGLSEREEKSIFKRGHVLEPLVVAAYERLKSIMTEPATMNTNAAYPWAAATPDRIIDPLTLLEVKTVNEFAFKSGEWGEDLTDEVPTLYYIQVQHQMAVTGTSTVRLVALAAPEETFSVLVSMAESGAHPDMLIQAIMDMGLHEYVINRDEEFIADLMEQEGEFWQKYVVNGEDVPDYPMMQDNGGIKAATPEDEALMGDLRQAYIGKKAYEESYKDLSGQFKNRIGEASGIFSEAFGRVTWKKPAEKTVTSTDWQAVAGDIADSAELAPEAFEHVVAEFTTTTVKPASRRFLCPRNWK